MNFSLFPNWRLILAVVLATVVIFLSTGSMPPGVNESHYLPKAARVWDPTFAAGDDLFLGSNDSHFLASMLAGSLSDRFEFETVAWIGRLISWLMMSYAWFRLAQAVRLPLVFQPLILFLWIFLVHHFHWAGEWFVGGFEAKSIAYPLAIWGLALAIESRWKAAWICLGASIAWHPVVGGWVLISLIPVWFIHLPVRRGLSKQWPSMLAGMLLGMIGVWPALQGLGSPDREGAISAAQVHAYFRLSHHMCPRSFDSQRWAAAALMLFGFAGLSFWWLNSQWRLGRSSHNRNEAPSTAHSGMKKAVAQITGNLLSVLRSNPLGTVCVVAWASVVISLIGLAIDTLGVAFARQDISARLLRFYWFRWSDVAVPMASALFFGALLTRYSFRSSDQAGSQPIDTPVLNQATPLGSYLILLSLGLGAVLGYLHWHQESQHTLAPADRWLLEKPGPYAVRYPGRSQDAAWQRYRDWLAVTRWIRENTPSDSLWLTPKHQQSFKWYAHRAEVVSWKDVPQDNASIIEWFRRVDESGSSGQITCCPPRNANGTVRGWTTQELLERARKYSFRWVLIDRSYQDQPPLLELKYPIEVENRSFAVFFISEAMAARPND